MGAKSEINGLNKSMIKFNSVVYKDLARLDRKVSRVQRRFAQDRYPMCYIEWTKNLLVVREDNLPSHPMQLLKDFERYIAAQEITALNPGEPWSIIVV